MAKFTVRVELHDEDEGDYPKLHKQMERRGFERTLMVDGTLYQMPNASYAYKGDETKEGVYDKARAAVDAIGRDAGIVVTKSDGGRFVGGLQTAWLKAAIWRSSSERITVQKNTSTPQELDEYIDGEMIARPKSVWLNRMTETGGEVVPYYLMNTDQGGARTFGVATSEHLSIEAAVAHYRTLSDGARRRGLPVPNVAIVETVAIATIGAEVPRASIIRRFATDGTPCGD